MPRTFPGRCRLAGFLALLATVACRQEALDPARMTLVSSTSPNPPHVTNLADPLGVGQADFGVTERLAAPVEITVNVGSMGSGPGLHLDPMAVIGPADAHVLGTCRNHVAGLFPNGPAKLAAMRALAPTWGGGHLVYRVGHGITDGRLDHPGMDGYHFEQCWNSRSSYPYDDLRGALSEADAMGMDQIHVVNFGSSDPAEAARYVSYLNHAGDANRQTYPIAQQNVRLFEIGNEVSWHLERGHDEYAPDEITYARRAQQFARAMRAASDVPILIGAVASTNANWQGDGWSGGAQTVRNLVATMGNDLDFVIFHGYPSWPVVRSGDLATVMAQNEWTRQKLESEILPALHSGGRDVRLANTEFFTNQYSDALHAQGLFGAIYAADSIALAMNERLLASVEFCFSHGTVADSAFFYDDDPTRPTPIYQLYALLARHWGDTIVRTRSDGLPATHVALAQGAIDVPVLATTGAVSADGNQAYMLVVNRTNDQDLVASVDPGFTPSSVTAYTLAGPRGWDSATAAVQTRTGVDPTAVDFAPASVTVLELRR